MTPGYHRPDGSLTLLGELAAKPYISQRELYPLPVKLPPQPVVQPPPVAVRKPLSLDAMIGIFFALLVCYALWPNLGIVVIVVSLVALFRAWQWLHARAPVTANVIALVVLTLISALLSAGGGRRRW